jgi:hypothetical protein
MIWHGSGTNENARILVRVFLLVDRMWHNPNRVPAAQGAIVTVTVAQPEPRSCSSGGDCDRHGCPQTDLMMSPGGVPVGHGRRSGGDAHYLRQNSMPAFSAACPCGGERFAALARVTT